jgi:hypothetical protein
MGWPKNLNAFVDLLKKVGSGIPGGNSKVDGFISNTSNYNVFEELHAHDSQPENRRTACPLAGRLVRLERLH